MTMFRSLFGLEASQIKPVCVMTPFLTRAMRDAFGVPAMQKGRPYGSGNSDRFTLIRTGIGPLWTGDAVLYLKETPCQFLCFLGSCGVIPETCAAQPGSLILPEKSFPLESFCALLRRETDAGRPSDADDDFLARFRDGPAGRLPVVACASLGSLKMETQFLDFFRAHNIGAVDMETSAFFSAAAHIRRPALAVLLVTDIVGRDQPFAGVPFPKTGPQAAAMLAAVRLILDFTQKITG